MSKQKLQLYKSIAKTKNIRPDTRSGLPIIDPLIFPLVWHVNQYQGLRTTQSCQGHLAKNILLRQDWIGDGGPLDSEAHISFCASPAVDSQELFELLRRISYNEEYIRITEITITCGDPNYCIWWAEYNTIEGMDRIMEYISGLKLELDSSVEPYHYLLDKVQGEWCKPKWVLR